MRTDAVHLGGLSAAAALVVGAAALVFERASADVLTARPAEFTEWAARYETELLSQSLFFVLSAGLLVLVWSGLRSLARGTAGAVALGAGLVYVGLSLSAQAIQVATARAAAGGIEPDVVATLADLMVVLLLVANLPLAIALGAVAVAGHRPGGGLPSWLGRLSAAAALVHLLPPLGIVASEGVMSAEGAIGYLAYPVFVVWLVAVAVVLLRAPAAADRPQVPVGTTP